MSNIATNRDLICMGSDLSRPRMTVENEKVNQFFPQFGFYGSGGNVSAVEGVLQPEFNSYYVRVELSSDYPYSMPKIWLLSTSLPSNCPHQYSDGSICVMKPEQWSSTYSLAFMIAKTALWINKFEYWQSNHYWPGKEQLH